MYLINSCFQPKNKFEVRYQPVIENSRVKGAFLKHLDSQSSTVPAVFGFNSAEGLNEAVSEWCHQIWVNQYLIILFGDTFIILFYSIY